MCGGWLYEKEYALLVIRFDEQEMEIGEKGFLETEYGSVDRTGERKEEEPIYCYSYCRSITVHNAPHIYTTTVVEVCGDIINGH